MSSKPFIHDVHLIRGIVYLRLSSCLDFKLSRPLLLSICCLIFKLISRHVVDLVLNPSNSSPTRKLRYHLTLVCSFFGSPKYLLPEKFDINLCRCWTFRELSVDEHFLSLFWLSLPATGCTEKFFRTRLLGFFLPSDSSETPISISVGK